MRIVLILLCILAAGLYLKILLPPGEIAPATVEQPLADTGGANLRPVPPSQLQVIQQVFAPEMDSAEQ